MLGHVYVVEDAKDLAQIVRDVTRYGGAYRPEVSLAPNSVVLSHAEEWARIYMSSFSADQTGRRLRRQWIRQCII